MARLSIALALIALLVGHAVASTGSDVSLGAAPTPVTIGVAPGPLPEHDFSSKHLAKISGIRMIASNVREAVRDKLDEVVQKKVTNDGPQA
jgi:hypothetical protein